jgi:hypothetical protein
MPISLKPVTRCVTLDGTTTSIASIFGMDDKTWIGTLSVRAGINNSGIVTWNDEHGQAGGYLQAEEAVTLDFGPGMALMRNIFLQGTANDTVYLTAGISRYYFDNTV